MKISSKLTHLALLYLPNNLKRFIRSSLPLSIKQSLARKVMTMAANNISEDYIRVKDGRLFKIIKDGHFLRVIYDKNYEPFLTAIARKLVYKNDTVIDVGANFGWYSTLFCLKSQGGEVISYEPISYSYKILEENIELNNMMSCITVRKVGVGDKKGHFLMDASIAGSLAHVVDTESESSVKVPVVTLNDELSDLKNKISYMKFDIEGSEHTALIGATNILDVKNQPILQIELNEEALNRMGSSRSQTIKFLKELGYSFFEADKNALGYLKKSNVDKCSDVFCFGKGKYTERLQNLLVKK